MGRFPKYESVYDHPWHLEHVNQGFCEAIHRTKVWCSKLAGHPGKHLAPGLPNKILEWDDRDTLKKPTKR